MKRFLVTIALLFTQNLFLYAQQKKSTISGNVDFMQDSDRVQIVISKYGHPDFTGYSSTYSSYVLNHTFQLDIPAENTPLRVRVIFYPKNGTRPKNIHNYIRLEMTSNYFENGDQVIMSVVNGKASFAGKGAAKFTVINHIKDIHTSFNNGINKAMRDNIRLYFQKQDSSYVEALKYLSDNSKLLSVDVFNLIKADILGAIIDNAGGYMRYDSDSAKSKEIAILNGYKPNIPKDLFDAKTFNKESILQFSDNYTVGLISQYTLDSCYIPHRPFLVKNCYSYIVENFKGVLRERLLVNLLFSNSYYRNGNIDPANGDNSWQINDAFNYVHLRDFVAILKKVKSSHMKGALAFNFNLSDNQGKMHNSAEYKGKVVFIDFWFQGCHNCIEVAPYLLKIEEAFAGEPVAFLSINMDTQKQRWLNGLASGKYSSKYAVNLFTQGLGFKHPIAQCYDVDGGPTLILIDKNGKLMDSVIDPRIDNGKNITTLIKTELLKK